MYVKASGREEAVNIARELMKKDAKLIQFSKNSKCGSAEKYIEANTFFGEENELDEEQLEMNLEEQEFVDLMNGKIIGYIYDISRVV